MRHFGNKAISSERNDTHGFDRMWFRHFSEIDPAEFIADVNA
jgi:hypothetical protein